MISMDRVLDELQRQLTKAKSAADEAAVRESLSAIESLCGLVLSGRESGLKQPAAVNTGSAARLSASPAASTQQESQPLEGKLLEEEDANGGSLFDF